MWNLETIRRGKLSNDGEVAGLWPGKSCLERMPQDVDLFTADCSKKTVGYGTEEPGLGLSEISSPVDSLVDRSAADQTPLFRVSTLEPWSMLSSSTPCGLHRPRTRAFAECSTPASLVLRTHWMTHDHVVLRGTGSSERSRFWLWPGRWTPCAGCSSRHLAGPPWTCSLSHQMSQCPCMRPPSGPSAWQQGTLFRSLGQWYGWVCSH